MTEFLKQQEPVTIKIFSEGVDEYGQKHTDYTAKQSTLFIRPYKQPIDEQDPRFNNVCLIGIGTELLSDNMNVIYDGNMFPEYKGVEFHVAYSIRGVSSKAEALHQAFLEKV